MYIVFVFNIVGGWIYEFEYCDYIDVISDYYRWLID